MRPKLFFCLLLICPYLSGQTYTYSTLLNFPATSKKGPIAPQNLIIDSSGNLYGLSSNGGASHFGTVFKVSSKGVLTVLHSFSGTDGDPNSGSVFPFVYANLTRDSKGNIYGATPLGGSTDPNCPSAGCGTVFKMTFNTNGTYTFSNLYSGASGQYPQGITLDSAGNIYGVSADGGLEEFTGCCFQRGAIFEITPSGTFTNWYDFDLSNGFDGATPIGNLILGKDGNFYGNTNGGGFVYDCSGAEGFSAGVVYEWSPQIGWSGPIHDFTGTDNNGCGVPDGAYPLAKLTQDASGNLYGTTSQGGTMGYGTVFKDGGDTILYNFCQQTSCVDGQNPSGPLVIDSGGNIYGVAPQGGANGKGVVFKITSTGQYSVIYNGGAAGVGNEVVIDKSGNLYGTTLTGGPSHNGSIYKLTKH